ncbi:MAG: hypothetical protein QM765_31250 [Myxococcales bacterium]
MDPSGLVHSVPRQPKNAIWEITTLCNLRCRHCESSAGCRDPNELLHRRSTPALRRPG